MSQVLINAYFNEIDRLIKFSGTTTEGVVSEAFKDLLKAWSRQMGLTFLSQFEFLSPQKNRIRPDGTIVHDLRVPLGYWEAKDSADDLETEIRKKFLNGYPQDNIIFENGETAILFQNRIRVIECAMRDGERLERLLALFFSYERGEIAEFRKAVAQFSLDLPNVLAALREKIDAAYASNAPFRVAAAAFLAQAKETINPSVSEADVREMLIQHILTEEIFSKVFDESDFHRQNNIAKALYGLEEKFFTGGVKKDTLKALEPYYAAIRANAAQITAHSEKQTFLKVIYEQFYKVYNPNAADRLGVVYTPNEIVNFMIEGADWLCEQHFGKNLIDKDVEILDPATGTGTFICALLEHFRGQPERLAQKYKEELHANEVAILPYYVANLNIEATYAAITGQFAEYPNLCFVDTLDNIAGLGLRAGHQHEMFGAMSDENVSRIKRQNARKISVIIGNPPYNANQQNENDNNKNRTYTRIDEVIKSTYIKQSTAQKTKLYDMYARFYRWASDRMSGEGILAFITNRSFIESRTFDGFRKCVAEEFAEIYIMDLGGDVRANPKLSGTKHNVFGIQTGVAIAFFIKKGGGEAPSSGSSSHLLPHRAFEERPFLTTGYAGEGMQRDLSSSPLPLAGEGAPTGAGEGKSPARIHYARRPEAETAEDKRAFLASTPMRAIPFTRIKPDAKGNWLGQTENDWESLIPVADKETKAAKATSQQQAIFKLFSLGVVTARDEWVYDHTVTGLNKKVVSFISIYENERARWKKSSRDQTVGAWVSREIKWTSELEAHLTLNHPLKFDPARIRNCIYRPFSKMKTYFDRIVTHRIYQQDQIFPIERSVENRLLVFSDPSAQKPWFPCVIDTLPDLHFVGAAAGTVCLPRYRYTSSGERIDNITDWALAQFVAHYGASPPLPLAGELPSSGSSSHLLPQAGEGSMARSLHSSPLPLAGEGAPTGAGEGSPLTKDAIFHYVYAVLHNPAYREKYALNLKREFPRVPFYPDFWAWAAWGEALMALHIGYETIEPWPITRLDVPDERARAGGVAPKPILKAEREAGIIRIDSETTLTGIPPVAFTYLLGNRSGLEWILDQYKEKTPKDPTIREKFNTYRFADYKEKVIDLLARVTRVSVETMAIVDEMREE